MAKPSEARETSAVDTFRPSELHAKGFPAPEEGLIVTHVLIIADQDRSRDFYSRVLGGQVIRERDPAVVRLSNSWLILNAGGGPTDDKPEVIAAPPESSHVLTSSLNIRVGRFIASGARAALSSSLSPRITFTRSAAISEIPTGI